MKARGIRCPALSSLRVRAVLKFLRFQSGALTVSAAHEASSAVLVHPNCANARGESSGADAWRLEERNGAHSFVPSCVRRYPMPVTGNLAAAGAALTRPIATPSRSSSSERFQRSRQTTTFAHDRDRASPSAHLNGAGTTNVPRLDGNSVIPPQSLGAWR